jgi:hypothetical protein
MNGKRNGVVNYELPASAQFFWKRFLRIWLRYNLLVGFITLVILLKSGYSVAGLLILAGLELLFSFFSWLETKTILFRLTYSLHSDTVQAIILHYSKPKEILLAPRKDVKLQVRKRYRYRYPVDCLLILYKNKEVYVQEESTNAWTKEQFLEIEKVYKDLSKDLLKM